MKKSKFFTRTFWFTLIFWLFYVGSSTYVGYYKVLPDYIFYHIGFMVAMILFSTLKAGYEKKELMVEINRLVKETEKEGRFLRV